MQLNQFTEEGNWSRNKQRPTKENVTDRTLTDLQAFYLLT